MAIIHGRFQELSVSTDGGTTWIRVSNVRDCNLSGTVDDVETTSKDTSLYKSYIPGHRDTECTGGMIYDHDDAGQRAMRTAFDGPTAIDFRYRTNTGSGYYDYTFVGYINSLEQGAPLDDVQTWDFTIKAAGAITEAAQ